MRCGGQGHHGGAPERHHGHGGGCGCGSTHGRHHAHGSGCGCGAGFGFGACFATRDEKVSWLEQYLESLQQEVQAVEERIAKLREEA